MANTILIKRGNKADLSSLELLPGELGVALDTQELYVGDAEGNVKMVKGGASGAVETADKLTVPRNISITGDGTGSTSFDGSADASIALTLANSGVSAGTYTKVTVDAKGRVTTGANVAIADVTGLSAKISEIEGKVTTAEGEIDALQSSQGTMETALEGKADKGDSLADYGITDAYTKGEVDSALADKADTTTVTALQSTVSGKADSATSLAGYGIQDAYTKTEVDAKVSSVYKYKGSVENEAALPQEGQVIGDVYNVEDTGMNVAWDGEKWDKLGSTVDLSAYMTIETANSTFATITTVNGKADKATTLEGYGITDAYTKTEVNNSLNNKADKATTLNGYGITDAYTKSEVDSKTAIATTSTTGVVKPDGTSITVDGDGTIHSLGKEYTAGTNMEITEANVINNTIPFKKQGNSIMIGDTNFGDDDYSTAENMTMGVSNTIAQVEEEGDFTGNVIMIGGRNQALGSNTVVLGQGNAASHNSVSIGQDNKSSAYSIAIGSGAIAGDQDTMELASIAIGQEAKALGGNSIVLGYEAETSEENVMAVGSSTSPINAVKAYTTDIPGGLMPGYHSLAFEEKVYSKTEADSLLSQKLGTSDVIDGGTF